MGGFYLNTLNTLVHLCSSLRTKILSTCPLPLTCSLQLLPTTQLYAKNPMLIVAQELLIGHQHHFQLGMFIIQPFNISQKS